jgi:ubiquinone/menaquinone biosynthesis C-methylase UbiE
VVASRRGQWHAHVVADHAPPIEYHDPVGDLEQVASKRGCEVALVDARAARYSVAYSCMRGSDEKRCRCSKTAKAILRYARTRLPFGPRIRRISSLEGYRLWSETYDEETNNVVIAIEEEILGRLLPPASLAGKVVLDIGCGTGRHWQQLLSRRPHALHGMDISPEMLRWLRLRHPDAMLHLRDGVRLEGFADASVDLVVSSLMLGYVQELDDELREWTRVLRTGGEIILTDFHPEALRAGAKRTFTHRGTTWEIENYIHTLDVLRSVFRSLNLDIVQFHEGKVDEIVRAHYERANALELYRNTYGAPLVVGFRLHRVE